MDKDNVMSFAGVWLRGSRRKSVVPLQGLLLSLTCLRKRVPEVRLQREGPACAALTVLKRTGNAAHSCAAFESSADN